MLAIVVATIRVQVVAVDRLHDPSSPLRTGRVVAHSDLAPGRSRAIRPALIPRETPGSREEGVQKVDSRTGERCMVQFAQFLC